MVKTEEQEYLMVYDYMVDKALDKIKERIGIDKFDDIKILIDTDNKVSDGITLKRVVILMTCIIKDGNKCYPQLFIQRALYNKQTECKAFKKDITKELMLVAWHPTRWWDWCLPEDEKKEAEPIFTDKAGRK